MKLVLCLGLTLTCFGACAGPDQIDLHGMLFEDRRYQAPAEPDGSEPAEAILRKPELALEDVLRIADQLNPVLAIERKNVDLATAAIWDARLYPNPSFGIEIEEYKTGGGFSESKRVAGVTVPFSLTGRIGQATAAAEKDRTATALNFVWRRREVLNDVKRAFIHVLATRRAEELVRESRTIAKALHDLTNERFKADAVPEMEVLKTAVHLATAESELKRAEADTVIAMKSLHSLMGDIDFPKERFSGALTVRFTVPSFEALRGQVLASHPLGEAARISKEAAEMHVSTAKSSVIPDLELSLAAGKDGENDTIIEGGIGIPLPMFNRNQGAIMAAEVRLRQAELQIQAVRNDLLLQLTEAYRTFTTAQERARAYQEDILPKAQKALEQTNDGHRLGKFGYLDVLDAQRTLAESRSAYAAALEDLNFAAADLEKLTGTRLEAIR